MRPDRAIWYTAFGAAALAGALAGPLGVGKLQLLAVTGGVGAILGSWWAWRLFR